LLLADIASGGRVLPSYDQLIVDEAHHLEEAATEQLTERASWRAASQWLHQLTLAGSLLHEVLQLAEPAVLAVVEPALHTLDARAQRMAHTLNDFAAKLLNFVCQQEPIRSQVGYAQRLHLNSGIRAQPRWSQVEIEWDNASIHLADVLAALAQVLAALQEARWRSREPHATHLNELEGIYQQLDSLRKLLDIVILADPAQRAEDGGLIAWFELNEKADTVHILAAPVSVSRLLEEKLVHQKRSVILTGATLRTGSGFDFIKERLGLWDVPDATLPSPFDYRNNTLLFMPSDLPEPNHPHYQQAVESAIVAAATATNGRTLVLFTSYAQLRITADAIRMPLDRLGITVLQQGGSGRQRLLREYRQTQQAVLLGTRTFWEGIDLPGDELLSLLIVRLPFAVPNDPLVAARSAECDNPFMDYTLPEAILRFRQGFGRLIRRASDRGAVILLDSRVWQKRYGPAFLDALPNCTECRAPLSNLQEEIERWMRPRE